MLIKVQRRPQCLVLKALFSSAHTGFRKYKGSKVCVCFWRKQCQLSSALRQTAVIHSICWVPHYLIKRAYKVYGPQNQTHLDLFPLYSLFNPQPKSMLSPTRLVAEGSRSPPSNREQNLQPSLAGSKLGTPRCGKQTHWPEFVPFLVVKVQAVPSALAVSHSVLIPILLLLLLFSYKPVF